jgi:hypothetical protein
MGNKDDEVHDTPEDDQAALMYKELAPLCQQ